MGLDDQATSEQELIQRCLNNDLSAYRELYEQHKNGLFNIAMRIHQNVQDAEDSLQEAFIKIFRALPDFKGECKLATWIYRIVLNTCLSRVNEKKTSIDLYEKFGGKLLNVSDSSSDLTAAIILEQEMAQLPAGYRTVFVLYEVEGFSHEEIAAILEITVGTSRSQLFKAKKMLRKRLKSFLSI